MALVMLLRNIDVNVSVRKDCLHRCICLVYEDLGYLTR